MNILPVMLSVAALALPALAADPPSSATQDKMLKAPKDPGVKTPVDPGAVVKPPRTGTEDMVTKPRRIDPEIDDATSEIDRKNRQKLEDKKKSK